MEHLDIERVAPHATALFAAFLDVDPSIVLLLQSDLGRGELSLDGGAVGEVGPFKVMLSMLYMVSSKPVEMTHR